MKVLLLLLFGSLFATVNEPLRWEVFSGYRNDRIHWHLPTYSELYRDIQSFENGLTLRAIHRDLSFFLRGSYGAFGRGSVFQRYAGFSSQPRFSTEGWSADAVGYFGYAINLTADRVYKVILTPLIGYSGYFIQLRRSSSLPGTFRLVWNGFFFGGSFTIEPVGRVLFHMGYSYHLAHSRMRTLIPIHQSIRASSGGNGGQTGWAQMDWALDRNLRLGIGGEIHYFTTHDVREKLKLRWTVFSGWAQISRSF